MKRIFASSILIVAISLFMVSPVAAETVAGTGSADIGAVVAAAGVLTVTILDRATELPGATSLAFNGGLPIDQSVAPKWLLSDQMFLVNYDSNQPSWAIRMVTDNITTVPGIEYQKSGDGTARFSSGLIRDASDIFNRARVIWEIFTDPTPTKPLDDDHVYGLDANNDGDFEDPGDVAPVWGFVSDKGDSSYAGWDGNNDGDMNETTDVGLDINNDGDYLDIADGDIPPDVEPNPTSAAYWTVQGVGANSFLMPYPDDNSPIGTEGDGSVYIYFGSDLGDGVAAGTYAATIYVELFYE